MKDKRLLYVLLPAVVVIWIVIGYRLYGAMKGDDFTPPVTRTFTPVVDRENNEPYQLQLNYADPFLKKENTIFRATYKPSLPQTSSLPAVVRETANVSTTVNWNTLAYFGMIENAKTTHRVGIVTLNGVRKLVRESDQISHFTIERILKDSMEVRSGQETKYIVKQGRIEWLSRRP